MGLVGRIRGFVALDFPIADFIGANALEFPLEFQVFLVPRDSPSCYF